MDADDFRACRREIAAHSKSFHLASALFPAGRRDEVSALYAWCRRCDDAVDAVPAHAHGSALKGLEEELSAVYDGAASESPILRAYQEVVRRRRIPIEYPRELLAGMAMDADDARYESVDELLVYCWRVAGTVGLMMCHVMGVSDARASRHAAHLGIAMQLTNICRDVLEDWARGRLYVPAELLPAERGRWLNEQRGRADRPPLPEGARGELAEAVRSLLLLAERYYASADAGMSYLEPRSALAVRTARLLYAEIGRRIEARGCDAMQGRAFVPLPRKLRLTGRALRRYAVERRAWRASGLVAPDGVLVGADAIRLA